MQYGMTFIIDMFDAERGEELHVLSMPGDYIRMCDWADKHLDVPDSPAWETARGLLRNYATAWFALRRRGKLAEMGLPDAIDRAALDAMADRFTIYVNEVEDGSLPLAGERAK